MLCIFDTYLYCVVDTRSKEYPLELNTPQGAFAQNLLGIFLNHDKFPCIRGNNGSANDAHF